MPDDDNLFDKGDFEALRTQTNVYKMKLAKFERQQEPFGGLVSCNQATIDLYIFTLIQNDKARVSLLERFNGRYQLKNSLGAQREDSAEGVKVADRSEDLIQLTKEPPLDAPYDIPDPDPIIQFADIRFKKSDDEPDAVMPTIEASVISTSKDNNSQTSKIPLSPPSDITETSPISDAPEIFPTPKTYISPVSGVSRSSEVSAT
ncbi:hypothetical protein MMC22_007691 [Lobaria immixta]|nr:hypothetical protein [Lobaria immixta]